MHQRNTLLRTTVIVLISLMLTGVSWTSSADGCHKINAKGKGYTVSMSETGVTTAVNIIGGGLLNGTTLADFVFTGGAGAEVFFTGTLVLTTKHGTVTYGVSSGTFNVMTLEFSSHLYVIDGDGRFEGATGTLYLSGVNKPDGTFTEDISGEICLAK